jgi:hypothetical protein
MWRSYMRVIYSVALLAVAVLVLVPISCSGSANVSRSVVKVMLQSIGTNLVGQGSLGVVVKDGSHVLTLIDYENYLPASMSVETMDGKAYSASVQSVDPRSGLTYLKLDGNTNLKAIAMGDSPKEGETVRFWESDSQGKMTLTSLKVNSKQTTESLFFSLAGDFAAGPVLQAGTPVINSNNQLLGLAMPTHNRLAVMTALPNPLIASITGANLLLSGDIDSQTWSHGPVLTSFAGQGHVFGYASGILTSPSDYDQMTAVLTNLMENLGQPITTDDLDLTNMGWYSSFDGTILVCVFPTEYNLKNFQVDTLGVARWVGLQWGRSEEKPNRLVYGEVPYIIEGGYELPQDLSMLQGSLSSVR